MRASGIRVRHIGRFANNKKKAFGTGLLLRMFQVCATGSAFAGLQFELRQAQTCLQCKTNVAETI
jgi:hypothetical protein